MKLGTIFKKNKNLRYEIPWKFFFQSFSINLNLVNAFHNSNVLTQKKSIVFSSTSIYMYLPGQNNFLIFIYKNVGRSLYVTFSRVIGPQSFRFILGLYLLGKHDSIPCAFVYCILQKMIWKIYKCPLSA